MFCSVNEDNLHLKDYEHPNYIQIEIIILTSYITTNVIVHILISRNKINISYTNNID